MTLEEAIEQFGDRAVLRAAFKCITPTDRKEYWFDLFKMGMDPKEIAEDLGIQLKTVSNGIVKKYKTASASDRAALVTRVRLNKPLIERFWDFVLPEPNTGCWLWNGPDNRKYGILRAGPNKNVYAHRLSYELHKGAIPKGLVIDHTCRITFCVNPDHLEAVTQGENVRRAWERKRDR